MLSFSHPTLAQQQPRLLQSCPRVFQSVQEEVSEAGLSNSSLQVTMAYWQCLRRYWQLPRKVKIYLYSFLKNYYLFSRGNCSLNSQKIYRAYRYSPSRQNLIPRSLGLSGRMLLISDSSSSSWKRLRDLCPRLEERQYRSIVEDLILVVFTVTPVSSIEQLNSDFLCSVAKGMRFTIRVNFLIWF